MYRFLSMQQLTTRESLSAPHVFVVIADNEFKNVGSSIISNYLFSVLKSYSRPNANTMITIRNFVCGAKDELQINAFYLRWHDVNTGKEVVTDKCTPESNDSYWQHLCDGIALRQVATHHTSLEEITQMLYFLKYNLEIEIGRIFWYVFTYAYV
mmetsp:Transcript_29449/g.41057  ORF Transcript_29449/g.41057 Transcript_29449/m.41057 type:complete len:154 (+) Transcript_29449:182-643(+)